MKSVASHRNFGTARPLGTFKTLWDSRVLLQTPLCSAPSVPAGVSHRSCGTASAQGEAKIEETNDKANSSQPLRTPWYSAFHGLILCAYGTLL